MLPFVLYGVLSCALSVIIVFLSSMVIHKPRGLLASLYLRDASQKFRSARTIRQCLDMFSACLMKFAPIQMAVLVQLDEQKNPRVTQVIRHQGSCPPRVEVDEMVMALRSQQPGCIRIRNGPVTYIHAPPSIILALVTPEQCSKEFTLIYSLTADFVRALSHLQQMMFLRQLVVRDPLTQLLNRRGFDHKLQNALLLPHASTLAFADLDSFKQINDTHGHARGDEILIGVANFFVREIAGNSRRRKIFVGRCGGDEFCLLFIGWSGEKAKRLLEKKLRSLRDCTVSMGLATFPRQANCIQELKRKADEALYVAKRCGRGRCIVYRDGTEQLY
ncbi:probable diguanylate cyclase DgcT [Ornithodoros turicata]|uniref:probable diguanylate cyclase DgcT n=1 Tax=Ornithodoros turicata TaxID=34597 RepID=UPI0031389989